MTSRPPPALLARHLSSTIVRQAAAGRHSPGEPKGRGVAWTEERSVSEPPGRGAAWTEERGTSDVGRRRLKAPRRASGEQSTSDEGRRRLTAPRRASGEQSTSDEGRRHSEGGWGGGWAPQPSGRRSMIRQFLARIDQGPDLHLFR